MSSGRSGGFSVPGGFAPAPHMSGGFNRGGLTSGVRSGLVGTPIQRGFNPSPTYRRNTLIPSGGVSRPRSFGNWHGPPLQNWRHTYGGRYRRPYAPYFYANSTYLVPGLLNSYWDYPDGFNAKYHILTSSRIRTTTTFSRIQRQTMAAEIKDKDQDRDGNIDRKMCLLHRLLPLSHFRWLP